MELVVCAFILNNAPLVNLGIFLGGVDESQNVPSQHRLRNGFETKKPFFNIRQYLVIFSLPKTFKSVPFM